MCLVEVTAQVYASRAASAPTINRRAFGHLPKATPVCATSGFYDPNSGHATGRQNTAPELIEAFLERQAQAVEKDVGKRRATYRNQRARRLDLGLQQDIDRMDVGRGV